MGNPKILCVHKSTRFINFTVQYLSILLVGKRSFSSIGEKGSWDLVASLIWKSEIVVGKTAISVAVFPAKKEGANRQAVTESIIRLWSSNPFWSHFYTQLNSTNRFVFTFLSSYAYTSFRLSVSCLRKFG